MFNNNFEYMDNLITDEKEIEWVMENRPEPFALSGKPAAPAESGEFRQGRVDSLLWAFRDIGYLYAKLNPLGEAYSREYSRLVEFQEGSYHRLTLEGFGLSEADLDEEYFGGMSIGRAPLREIFRRLKETYCSFVGVEFLHIQNKDIRQWLIERMESTGNITEFSREQKKTILNDLIKTEELENFLHRTFLGEKRFSIQGADVVVPALHYLVDSAHRFGIEEIVMGTSHRGRLSILNFILNQPPEEIFYLFEENFVPGVPGGSGDVRYHIGYCARHVNDDGTQVNITLLPNSSHLESVDGIVEGNARGIQDRKGDSERKRVMPVILHGDASFSAQGVVAEVFNLSQLKGYTTGGTIHIVVNNQIGYTTSPARGHSGLNPTDIAKMMPVPVMHVNGDEPEAVMHVMQMAMEYRQAFNRDVVVDIICYRRYGHNEGDEPSYTQPHMYELIRDHESTPSMFLRKCLAEGVVGADEANVMRNAYKEVLTSALGVERRKKAGIKTPPRISGENTETDVRTSVDESLLLDIAKKTSTVPLNFNMHSRLKRIIENNYRKFRDEKVLDWGMAEVMAFGALLAEGVPVRLSGQDSERGTFSQRHLVWWEVEKEDCCHIMPLENISGDQAKISVNNSPLSEYSVLAFEYGYAVARPDALVMWEAQFGDFVNGAQVIVDNYLIAARSKWNIKNGLVLLLPHGLEGMGPEHSNAYLERFLQLCSENNISVCNISTPAQYFHLLRRQKRIIEQRPLVIMTPKSLLRNPRSLSTLQDLSTGSFQRIIADVLGGGMERLLFCTGKIYYDLTAEMNDEDREAIGIVRVEQLYPFPDKEIGAIFSKYGNRADCIWVQEEPRNRGAWRYVHEQFEQYFPEIQLRYVGREASASPAVGSLKRHNEEQKAIVDKAVKDHDRIRVMK